MNILKYIAVATLLTAGSNALLAQTAAVKKADESVFTLTTFDKNGSILASAHGVFVVSDGTAISNLKPFVGAVRAVAIDKKGNSHDVERMIGADELYDVAKFKVAGTTKSSLVATSPAGANATLWLVPFGTKGAKPISAQVKSVETFMDKYSYYIFPTSMPDNTEACPFVNDQGQVVGIMQTSKTGDETHATDAAYVNSLALTGLTFNNATMQSIGIPALLPKDKDQAMLALMVMKQSADSLKLDAAISDFISLFPNLMDGYTDRAQLLVDNNRFDEARRCMETALSNVDEKDDAHYNYARLIYMKELYKADKAYEPWSLDKALEEIHAACAIKDLPMYRNTEAEILYAKKDYQKAYDIFMQLNETNMKSGDLFYNAALCKENMKAPDTEILALLDSAVNNADTLNIRLASKYFLMRGGVYNRMKNYRQAVFDYTRYDVLNRGSLGADFYYMRSGVEVNAKLFKQALTDLDLAVYLDPKEPVYIAEKASLQLRLNLVAEAMETAKKAIEVAPEFSDSYLVLGLAQIKSGKKSEGIANLNKAKEMGNSQAQTLIDKYAK